MITAKLLHEYKLPGYFFVVLLTSFLFTACYFSSDSYSDKKNPASYYVQKYTDNQNPDSKIYMQSDGVLSYIIGRTISDGNIKNNSKNNRSISNIPLSKAGVKNPC